MDDKFYIPLLYAWLCIAMAILGMVLVAKGFFSDPS